MPYRSTGGVRNGSRCQSQPLRRTAAAPPSPGRDGAPPAAAADGKPAAASGPKARGRRRWSGRSAARRRRTTAWRRGWRPAPAQLRVGEQRTPVGRGARSAHQFPGGGEQRQIDRRHRPRASRISVYRSGAAIPAPARQPMPREAQQAPAADPAAAGLPPAPALAVRQTLRIQYARIAPDGGIGLAQLRLRGEQEIGHYFGASDSAGVSRDGNKMDVAEGPRGKTEAVAVRR